MWHSRNGDVCLKRQSCTRLVQLTCFKRLNFVFEGKSLHSSLCYIFHSFTTGLRVAGQLLQTSLSLPFKKHLQQYARDQSNHNNILPTIVEEYTLPRGYWLICKPMWLGLQQLIIQQLPSASSNQSKLEGNTCFSLMIRCCQMVMDQSLGCYDWGFIHLILLCHQAVTCLK